MTLDGNARLNLATFVSTWMEPTAEHLYAKAFDKNIIDKDEYPQTAEIEERCVRILANLWHSPAPYNYGRFNNWIVGSLYARGLALKRRWQNARKREGKPVDRPNIVFSSAVQVVWEKFANYWEVEPRYVKVSPEHPRLDPQGVLAPWMKIRLVWYRFSVRLIPDFTNRLPPLQKRWTIYRRGQDSTFLCM